jgi:DNA-binding FadR family transcriptional regulator
VATADEFPPIALPRASDAVSRALVDGIRAGLAPVGSKLPKDSELARAFGVSRAGVGTSVACSSARW